MEAGLLIPIIAIAILLCLSAFFSGSETALTAASKVRLTAKAREGNKRASMVNKIRDQKDRMIGALLLGNNLVNILASALATSVLIKVFGPSGVFYATFVMTLLVLIFAEVLPKTYAFHYADTMSMRIAPAIRFVIMIFAPVTETVTFIVRGVLRLFGVDISKVTAGSHLELLRGVIDMHDGKGKETQEQRAMLRSILDLFDVDVEDIMIHRQNVKMIDADADIEKSIEDVLSSPYTRLPLWRGDQDNIIGIVHARWLIRELQKAEKEKAEKGKAKKLKIESVALEPWFIPETTNLFDQLQAFRERKEHFALVVDEYGTFQGIVTLEDILEEIVGEIDDEHDMEVEGVRKIQDGSYLVDGTVTIRDLNREFDWRLPDEEYSTLAGLILFESQSLPETGQCFRFHKFRFDIIKRARNQITLIRVTPPKKMKRVKEG
jgi:Mg2+/Co2+ transporter CorB